MMSYKYYDLIRKPIITEKSTILSELNKYSFTVMPSADKSSIRNAIEHIFAVKVTKVHIMNMEGKKKRFKGRMGCRVNSKKAIVTLESGYSIDFAGVK